MKVRMLKSLGGQWPPAGEEHEVADFRLPHLLAMGWCELIEVDEPEEPTEDDPPETEDG